MPFTEADVEALLAGQPAQKPPVQRTGYTEADVRAMFEEDDAATDAQLGTIFESALRTPPDRQAKVLELVRQTGAPADVVESKFDELSRAAEAAAFDPRKFRTENPALAELLLERPELGPIVYRDEQVSVLTKALRAFGRATALPESALERLERFAAEEPLYAGAVTDFVQRQRQHTQGKAPKKGAFVRDPAADAEGLSRPLEIFSAAYRNTSKQLEYGEVGADILRRKMADQPSSDLELRAAELERELVPRTYDQGPVEQLLVDVAEAVPSQLQVLKGGTVGGAVGAVIGAALGAAGTRSPQGAKEGARTGFKVGAGGGAALSSYELESGSAYLEMRRARTDDGRPVDDHIAVGAAVAYGVAAAAIEMGSMGSFLGMFGPLGDAIRTGSGKAFMRSAMKDRTFREILGRVGKAWLKGAAVEGGEEFAQSLTQDVFTYLAKVSSAGELQEADPATSLEQALLAGQKGLVAGAGMGTAGSLVSLTTQEIARGRAERAGEKVAAIVQTAGSSPTARAAPEVVAQLIERETTQSGEPVTHLYVDAGAFTRFFQDGQADALSAARELMGEDGVIRLQEAIATGGKLEVPVAEYLQRWGTKPLAEALAADTTTRPGYLTPRELQAQAAELEEQAKAIAEKYEKSQGEPQSGAEARLVDAVQQQLVATGTQGERDARTATLPLRQFIRTQAARFGMPADELFRDWTVRVTGPDSAIQGTEALTDESRARIEAALKGDTAAIQELARGRYADTLTPAGNKAAFTDFRSRPRKGVFVSIDFNQFKAINDTFGHDVGDRAISIGGNALAAASRAAGGKLFRPGGDEFVAHFDTRAQAERFVAAADEAFQALEPIAGDRKLSFSAGLGGTFEAADRASYEAKRGAKQAADLLTAGRGYFAWDERGIQDEDVLARFDQEGVQQTPLERAVAEHEDRIRQEAIEHAVAVAPDGTVILQHTSGHASRVEFTHRQIDAIRQRADVTFTHNHPSGGTISADDILLATFANVREMRAVARDGVVWRLVRPAAGWGYGDSDFHSARMAFGGAQDRGVRFAKHRMDEIVLAAGGNPLEGPRAKGYTDELWRQICNEEIFKSFNEFSADVDLGWQVEKLEPGALGRDRGDRRHPTDVPAGEGRLEQASGAGTARGFVEFAREGTKRLARIALNRNADLSTFLHESGHVFLEMLGDLSERPDAPHRLKEDFATALKYLGVEKRSEIRREHHEKWARSFEAYLLEGRSPSAPLARAFARFRLWLLQVYRSIASLNAQLNEEIRGVFDRMLATDVELDRTQRAMGLAPLWRSPEEAGMTPEQWQGYLDSQEKATSHAARAAELRIIKDKLRETEKWWQAEEAKLRDEAEKEYDALPEVRAYTYLRTGQLTWSSEAGVTRSTSLGGPQKLDRQAVLDLLGPDRAAQLASLSKAAKRPAPGRKPITTSEHERAGQLAELEALLGKDEADRGAHPDEVAELFGFPTGKDLLEALLARPEKAAWSADRARKRMLERHPDILEEKEELARLAAGALHSEFTSSWLLQELNALREKAYVLAFNPEANRFQGVPKARLGMKPPPVEAIKLAAAQIVERSKVRVLDASRALQAERTAAEKAARAAAKGDFAQAYVQKQQQVLNHFIYAELERAREERDKLEQLAGDLSKDKARARLGKAAPVYRDAVDGLLETLGLKDVPEDRELPLAPFGSVVQTMEANGDTVAFDLEVLERILAQPRSFKDLTVSEMRSVLVALKNIKKSASNRTSVMVEGKRLDKEQVVAELVREAEANRPDRGPATSSPEAETAAQSALAFGAGIDGSLLRPETMLGWLAGAGSDLKSTAHLKSTWFKAILLPLQEAKHREADLLKRTVKPIIDAFEKVPKSVRARFMEKVDGGKLFPNHREDLSPPTRRFELLMLALNAGNESNLERLLQGRNITMAELHDALDTLTREELEWVQSIWDASDSLWPEARALEERDAGIAPPKIQARPLVTKHGTFRGGYFPAVYDRRVEQAGERQEAKAIADLFDPSYTRPGTSHSHLKGRVKDFTGALTLSPGTIYSHLAQVAHDIAFREVVKSAGGLILDPAIDAVLKRRLGDGRAQQFLHWLKDVGQMRGAQASTPTGALNSLLHKIRGNTAIAVLGLAPSIAIGDFSNLLVGSRRLHKKHWAAGLLEFATHPWRTSELALEKSGELRYRRDQLTREFNRQVKQLTKTGVLHRGPLAWFRDHAFTFMEWSDKATSTPLWVGAYRQALAAGESEADAVRAADALIRKVFPSHSAVDQAGLLRDKGYWGAATMFYGYLNVMYNEQRDILEPVLAAHGADRLRSLPRAAGQLMALYITYNVVGEFLMGRGPEEGDGDDPVERWANWFVRKLLVASLNTIPGEWGGLLEAHFLDKKPSIRAGPISSFVESIGRAVGALLRDEPDAEKSFMALIRLLGLGTGLPTRPITQTGKYVVDVARGDAEPQDPFDVVGGLLYGEREGQPANPASVASDIISGE